mmetsp:Transcript_17238/g.35998  ORF Transcript_17238/g.35998 Transcript_17238/m.35998 type:complete len:206 (-) Transcript_17238:71-688(-)
MVVIGRRRRRVVVGRKRGLASAANATQAPSPCRCRWGLRFVRVAAIVAVVLRPGEGTASRGPSSALSPLRFVLRRRIQFELGDFHQGPGTARAPLPPRSRRRLLRGLRSSSRPATGAPGASRALDAFVAFGRRQGVRGGHRGVARGRGRWTTRSGLGLGSGLGSGSSSGRIGGDGNIGQRCGGGGGGGGMVASGDAFAPSSGGMG